MMVKQVEIEFIVTDTEAEALALEANLIKQPTYFNVLLKDDKKYPYCHLVRGVSGIFITRNRRLKKRISTTDPQTHGCLRKYCGYPSGSSHGNGLNLVQRPRLS